MLAVKNLIKIFEGRELLKGVTFSLKAGEIVCLLGASGSGKSTLLRIIAGLDTADGGSVEWDGADISGKPTHLRKFGMMFQDYALFSHLTVKENIAYGLRMQAMPEEDVNKRLAQVTELTHLQLFLSRSVQDLSGGEQQRVALARALAPNPLLMMLDEPLGALDRKLKEQLLADLRQILKASNLPTIYVTHDQGEAYAIADRILLLNDGEIVQDANPQSIHEHPANEWVARFMGLGNVIDANVVAGGLSSPIGVLPATHSAPIGSHVKVLIRPKVTLSAINTVLQGVVRDVQFTGDGYKFEVDGSLTFLADTPVKVGDRVYFGQVDVFVLG